MNDNTNCKNSPCGLMKDDVMKSKHNSSQHLSGGVMFVYYFMEISGVQKCELIRHPCFLCTAAVAVRHHHVCCKVKIIVPF